MAHLIQPLDVDGTVYCVAYNGNRTTQPVNTEIIYVPTDLATITDPNGEWEMVCVGVASDFEVSFGVGCGSEVNLYFAVTTTATDWQATFYVHVNGNATPAESLFLNETDGDTGNIFLSISDVPCGSVITVYASLEDPDEAGLSAVAQIVSVT